MTSSHEIGKNGRRGWLLPADMKWFVQLTSGHPMIMGRKTYARRGRPFPGRQNIVITHDMDFKDDGIEVAHSPEQAIEIARRYKDPVINIIGGQEIFEQTIDKVDRIYLSIVHHKIDGDRFFYYDPEDWTESSHQYFKADEKNKYDYEFVILDKKRQ